MTWRHTTVSSSTGLVLLALTSIACSRDELSPPASSTVTLPVSASSDPVPAATENEVMVFVESFLQKRVDGRGAEGDLAPDGLAAFGFADDQGGPRNWPGASV